MEEEHHKFTNMGKVKRLEFLWQLYVTSLPVRDLSGRLIFVEQKVPLTTRLKMHKIWNMHN